ncbi:MAG: hypothetical protein WDW36_000087 [Sanguina aurantia]
MCRSVALAAWVLQTVTYAPVVDLVWVGASDQNVFAITRKAGVDTGGAWRSADGGSSWKELTKALERGGPEPYTRSEQGRAGRALHSQRSSRPDSRTSRCATDGRPGYTTSAGRGQPEAPVSLDRGNAMYGAPTTIGAHQLFPRPYEQHTHPVARVCCAGSLSGAGERVNIINIWSQKSNPGRVVFQGTGTYMWLSHDFGETFFPPVQAPARLAGSGVKGFKFHPRNDGWLLMLVKRPDCKQLDKLQMECPHDLWLTKDLYSPEGWAGRWQNLTANAQGAIAGFVDFDWGLNTCPSQNCPGIPAIDEDSIFATKYQSAGSYDQPWDADLDFAVSEDFFASVSTHVRCGNAFEVLGRSIYMAVANSCPTEIDGSPRAAASSFARGITLYTSTDAGATFTQACLPIALKQEGYELLETHDGTGAVLIVDYLLAASIPASSVYTAGPHHALFSLSLTNVYHADFGFATDFSRIEGVPGVYISNQMLPRDPSPSSEPATEAGSDYQAMDDFFGSPLVESRISFNGGGHWQRLAAPTAFRHPQCDRCDGSALCYLHLHGMSSWDSMAAAVPAIYSNPSAPGMIMSTGNVGPKGVGLDDNDGLQAASPRQQQQRDPSSPSKEPRCARARARTPLAQALHLAGCRLRAPANNNNKNVTPPHPPNHPGSAPGRLQAASPRQQQQQRDPSSPSTKPRCARARAHTPLAQALHLAGCRLQAPANNNNNVTPPHPPKNPGSAPGRLQAASPRQQQQQRDPSSPSKEPWCVRVRTPLAQALHLAGCRLRAPANNNNVTPPHPPKKPGCAPGRLQAASPRQQQQQRDPSSPSTKPRCARARACAHASCAGSAPGRLQAASPRQQQQRDPSSPSKEPRCARACAHASCAGSAPGRLQAASPRQQQQQERDPSSPSKPPRCARACAHTPLAQALHLAGCRLQAPANNNNNVTPPHPPQNPGSAPGRLQAASPRQQQQQRDPSSPSTKPRLQAASPRQQQQQRDPSSPSNKPRLCTWLSTDSGVSWSDVGVGPHIYEFADWGRARDGAPPGPRHDPRRRGGRVGGRVGLWVGAWGTVPPRAAVRAAAVTLPPCPAAAVVVVLVSQDYGRCWAKVPLDTALLVDNIRVEPEGAAAAHLAAAGADPAGWLIRCKLATRPCSPPDPARHQTLLATRPCSPPDPARHQTLLATRPRSPPDPARHQTLLATRPCSPPDPARHQTLLATRPRSPPDPARHQTLLATRPCSPPDPARHQTPCVSPNWFRIEPDGQQPRVILHGRACRKPSDSSSSGGSGCSYEADDKRAQVEGLMYVIDAHQLDGAKMGQCDANADYSPWTVPTETHTQRCVLGQTMQYTRRKQDSHCLNGAAFLRPPATNTTCNCTAEDVECDYGFMRSTAGACAPISAAQMPACPATRPPTSYAVSASGRRLVHGDVCGNVGRVIDDTDGTGKVSRPPRPASSVSVPEVSQSGPPPTTDGVPRSTPPITASRRWRSQPRRPPASPAATRTPPPGGSGSGPGSGSGSGSGSGGMGFFGRLLVTLAVVAVACGAACAWWLFLASEGAKDTVSDLAGSGAAFLASLWGWVSDRISGVKRGPAGSGEELGYFQPLGDASGMERDAGGGGSIFTLK